MIKNSFHFSIKAERMFRITCAQSTGRQQCRKKPSANDNIYAEESVSKKAPLLAAGSDLLPIFY